VPYYSYETCGVDAGDTFARWAASRNMAANELQGIVNAYVGSVSKRVEMRILDLRATESQNSECQYTDSCSCTMCDDQEGWGTTRIDFGHVSVTHPADLVDNKKSRDAMHGQCLAQTMEAEMKRVAMREYSDPTRVAYMYYANQAHGMYFQWPGADWCPDTYDARYRPWYVQTVTGPKDVILLVDSSGSMRENSRNLKVLDAIDGLLRTFSDRDYVGLISFTTYADTAMINRDEDPMHMDEPVMVRMTDGTSGSKDNKKSMKADAESVLRDPFGGTNFHKGFELAFEMIRNSMNRGYTTRCNQVLLFLTDGLDESGQDILAEIRGFQSSLDNAVPIFTYSFGDIAATKSGPDAESAQLPHKIACQNSGLAYDIPDGGSVADR
jgi:hypothetical protein